MKWFNRALLVSCLLILLIAEPGSGQLIRKADYGYSPWALELSGFANLAQFDFEDSRMDIEERRDHFDSEGYDITDVHFLDDSGMMLEARLGARVRHVHFGVIYSTLPSTDAGLSRQLMGLMPNQYSYSVESREILGYLGYMHPLDDTFLLGAFVSVGAGFADGSYVNTASPNQNISEAGELDLNGTYTAWRVEFRGRARLTPYIALDAGVGYRSSELEQMEIDISNVVGDESHVHHRHPTAPVEFDWSGIFFGGGITLTNPYGVDKD